MMMIMIIMILILIVTISSSICGSNSRCAVQTGRRCMHQQSRPSVCKHKCDNIFNTTQFFVDTNTTQSEHKYNKIRTQNLGKSTEKTCAWQHRSNGWLSGKAEACTLLHTASCTAIHCTPATLLFTCTPTALLLHCSTAASYTATLYTT